MNIARLIEDNIARFGQYDFLFYNERSYTNVELNRATNQLANALRRLGVKKGERVGVQLLNCPELIQTFFAVFRLGAVLVPINPALREAELRHLYQDSGLVALVSHKDYSDRIREAVKTTAIKHVLLLGEELAKDALAYADALASGSDERVMEETDNDDLAVILYTAGTTGNPKGVMLTHYNWYTLISGYYDLALLDTRGILAKATVIKAGGAGGAAATEEIEIFGVDRGRSSLIALPLFHGYGIFTVNAEFLAGGRLILMSRWDVDQALQYIERYRVTDFRAVPTMYIQILHSAKADAHDLSSLKLCISGSAPLPLDVARRWREKYGKDIWEGYGLSEAAAVNCGNAAAKRPPKYGSVGVCYQKCNTIKVFDQNDRELAAGQIGEVVIKGPTIMKGYWNKPEETARVLRNGWLYTGDIGFMDEDGYLFLTERKKDLIIRGGENVYPKEVENVLHQHPEVLEAGVIGVPDETYGEEVKAFVVLRTPGSTSEQELLSFCSGHLPNYKRPKSIRIMDALPKSAVGKILRRELRKLA
ncbi:MAG: AMP-binding protein [Deltaproteobacteria bacterium]|nr:AMP-binding protein [Deltaproteobacteria bacterium]